MAGEGARLRRGAEETKEGMSPGQLLLVLGVVLLVVFAFPVLMYVVRLVQAVLPG